MFVLKTKPTLSGTSMILPSSIEGITGSNNNVVKGQSIPTSRQTSQKRKHVGKTHKKTAQLLPKLKLCYSVCVFMCPTLQG